MLRYLSQLNLVPGYQIKVLNVEPFDGPSIVQVEDDSPQTDPESLVKIIGRSLAKRLFVKLAEQPAA